MSIVIKVVETLSVSPRIQKSENNVFELYVSRHLLELDCLYNMMSFSICAPYIYYSSEEAFNPTLIERTIRSNLMVSFIEDLFYISKIIDLIKINYKYILYKRLYDLASMFRDIGLFKVIAYNYLFSRDKRSVEIDRFLKSSIETEDTYIERKFLLELIEGQKGIIRENIYRFKVELSKLMLGIRSIRTIIDEHVNPYINVFREIPLEKNIDLSLELVKPEELISLPEGVLVRGLKLAGKSVKTSRKKISLTKTFLDKLSSARVREYSGVRVVEKRFLDISSVKWLFSAPVLEVLKRYKIPMNTDPLERLWNDYMFTIRLRELNLLTPRIFYIDPWNYTLVREYIDAEDLLSVVIEESREKYVENICRSLGRSISLIHNNNICLGDTNPRNFLIKRDSNSVYFVDLEQASICNEINNITWDLSMIAYFFYLLSPQKTYDKVSLCLKCFFEGYIAGYRDSYYLNRIINRLDNTIFLTIFLMASSVVFSPISTASVYKAYSELREIKNSFSRSSGLTSSPP
ncbi:MAG: hypothetical protein ABWJ42_00200 [Sulfolobales archaeon]